MDFHVDDVFILDNEKKIYTKKDLRDCLIQEIKRDTLENTDDKDIVKNNLEMLEKIMKDSMTTEKVIKELNLFGYIVTSVQNTISSLSCLIDFFEEQDNKEIRDLFLKDLNRIRDNLADYFEM